MDWTMISNAPNSAGRILTLHYLLAFRYQATPRYAAIKLREVPKSNGLWGELLVELKAELIANEVDLETGGLGTDEEVRKYFSDMLKAYYTKRPVLEVLSRWRASIMRLRFQLVVATL